MCLLKSFIFKIILNDCYALTIQSLVKRDIFKKFKIILMKIKLNGS